MIQNFLHLQRHGLAGPQLAPFMEPSVDEQIFRTELLIRAGDRYKYRTVSLASQGHRVECRHSSEGLYRSRKKTYLTPETGRDPDTPSDMMQ